VVNRRAVEWVSVVAAVVATTLIIAGLDPGATFSSGIWALRHLFVIPTAWSAVRFGLRGGLAVATLSIVLDAPFVLPRVETHGIDAATVDGAVTFGFLLVLGGLAGMLSDRARRRLSRYTTAVALQRAVSSGAPLGEALRQASDILKTLLTAGAVEIIVRRQSTDYVGASGSMSLRPGTAGAWVAERGRALFIPDAPAWASSDASRTEGAKPPRSQDAAADAPATAPDVGAGSLRIAGRPRRVIVVPLALRGIVIGMVAAERWGDFSRDDRAALEALAVVLTLALENARLGEQLEAKVAAATERLLEIDRAKTDFLAAASHELRTPLTSLCGFSELLLARRLPEHQRRRFITVIHTEATRLGRIVDDLLDLSRIEAGRGPDLRPVPLAVEPALRATAELFRASGNHRFQVIAAADLSPVLGDPDAVGRILNNLVSNAVKYSPPGTEIRLIAAPAGREVEISVEDDGIGIPEHALGQIFDRYYRVGRRPGGPPGLGLGLALVKSLVESHGGSIRVESDAGRGSRFTLSLPAVS
jgi:signal transduction histidine kinase